MPLSRPFSRRGILAALAFAVPIAGWVAWPRKGFTGWAEDPAAGNRAFNLSLIQTPAQRAMPTSEAELVDAFAEIMRLQSAFAVQSSGHCFAGLSQTDAALLDLRAMNAITIDEAAQTLTAGPGAQVGEVNAATAPFGLALSAGYCQSVALGGHVSGGGVGILSRRFGLASDQLIAARILTANGQVKVASESENADLLWALRGGGAASFGIVTQYTLQLREPGTMAHMDLRFAMVPEDAAAWLEDWQTMTMQADPRLSFVLYIEAWPDNRIGMRAVIISSLDEAESEQAFNALVALGNLVGRPSVRWGSFQDAADVMWPRGYYGERSTRIGSDLLGGVVGRDVWQGVTRALGRGLGHGLTLILERLGGVIDDVAAAQTAYGHRGEAAFKVQYSVFLPTDGDPQPAYAGLVAALRPSGTGGAFFNYPEIDRPDWGLAYFGANFARLREVKRRYDPDNVFHHPLSIPVE